jgi:hypothetical protein
MFMRGADENGRWSMHESASMPSFSTQSVVIIIITVIETHHPRQVGAPPAPVAARHAMRGVADAVLDGDVPQRHASLEVRPALGVEIYIGLDARCAAYCGSIVFTSEDDSGIDPSRHRQSMNAEHRTVDEWTYRG